MGSKLSLVVVGLLLVVSQCRDLYSILHVSKSASAREITAQYRRLAKALHPDRSDDPAAHDKLVELNTAYEVLGNPAQRRQYDVAGADSMGPSQRAGSRSFAQRARWHWWSSPRDAQYGSSTADLLWAIASNPLSMVLAALVLAQLARSLWDPTPASRPKPARPGNGQSKSYGGPAGSASDRDHSGPHNAQTEAPAGDGFNETAWQHPLQSEAALHCPALTHAHVRAAQEMQSTPAILVLLLLPPLRDEKGFLNRKNMVASFVEHLPRMQHGGGGTRPTLTPVFVCSDDRVVMAPCGGRAAAPVKPIIRLHHAADRALRKLVRHSGADHDSHADTRNNGGNADECAWVIALTLNASCGTCKAAVFSAALQGPLHGLSADDTTPDLQGWCLSLLDGNVRLKPPSVDLFAALSALS
jgi:curved DNA-binding protein CbpA